MWAICADLSKRNPEYTQIYGLFVCDPLLFWLKTNSLPFYRGGIRCECCSFHIAGMDFPVDLVSSSSGISIVSPLADYELSVADESYTSTSSESAVGDSSKQRHRSRKET